MNDDHNPKPHHANLPTRRTVLGLGGSLVVGGSIAGGLAWHTGNERGWRARVWIGRASTYDEQLAGHITDGLSALGVNRDWVRGKTVLLKPNLVETAISAPHINTHPSVVVAATEAFRRMDAAEVFVAEGQGHRRDSVLVLDESGMGAALHHAGIRFVDLNHDDVAAVPNAGHWTRLDELYLPQSLQAADIVVSMPKMKTHHWAGITCSMKNLFGVMPGVVYGWPKNVLHHQGIHQSILDINATVKPDLAIVDGIIGMEGDGPIMGTPRRADCLVIGRNLPAVDATVARLMQTDPHRIGYLRYASGWLGPVREANITQRGDVIANRQTGFAFLQDPRLAKLVRG